MVSSLVTIATNYFGFYKLVSITWFSCSESKNKKMIFKLYNLKVKNDK